MGSCGCNAKQEKLDERMVAEAQDPVSYTHLAAAVATAAAGVAAARADEAAEGPQVEAGLHLSLIHI